MLLTKVAKPMSRKKIRKFANMIRSACNKEKTHEFPVVHFLENIMPIICEDFIYDIVEDHELDCEARAFPNCHEIRIRKSVYEGAYYGNPRDLFTIAHEIGHLF